MSREYEHLLARSLLAPYLVSMEAKQAVDQAEADCARAETLRAQAQANRRALYQRLNAEGVSQRQLAAMASLSPARISELILGNRKSRKP